MAKNGKSYSNGRGGFYNYDDKGNYSGKSVRRANGTINNYDSKGNYTGSSRRSFGNTYTHYDRFRDNVLAKNIFGREFIRLYYAVSPQIVRTFGKTEFFRRFWKVPLDQLVRYLKDRGTEDTPYCDRDYH